ncbi:TMEM175 family protein [Tersicoccus sp. MR15.9]|uniref:TMEM175 family protein n=1 Tax=Tersicoccus mangrovi TaxID=3121635 RepID=UPI002FE62193
MRSERTGAFSDAVIAIAITVMVLELPKPDGPSWAALRADVPVLLAYVLSFVYLGIYWNNHHQMLAAVSRVSSSVLWANLHLLFWLTLVPFTTAWMSEQDFAAVPVAAYGIVLLMNALAYMLLQARLLHAQDGRSTLHRALGRDLKGRLSPFLYVAGILLTLVHPWLAIATYVVVAAIWLIPDARIERQLARDAEVPDASTTE